MKLSIWEEGCVVWYLTIALQVITFIYWDHNHIISSFLYPSLKTLPYTPPFPFSNSQPLFFSLSVVLCIYILLRYLQTYIKYYRQLRISESGRKSLPQERMHQQVIQCQLLSTFDYSLFLTRMNQTIINRQISSLKGKWDSSGNPILCSSPKTLVSWLKCRRAKLGEDFELGFTQTNKLDSTTYCKT